MSKRDLLSLIKKNDAKAFNDYLTQGGDYNEFLYGKSLLAHSLLYERGVFIKLLLLHGADTTDLKLIEGWEEKLARFNGQLLEIFKELESCDEIFHTLGSQKMLDSISLQVLGARKLSYRNALGYVSPLKDLKKITIGLHIFEGTNPDFMLEGLRKKLGLDYFLSRHQDLGCHTKYVLLLSTSRITDEDRLEIPDLSKRLTSFAHIREVSAERFHSELREMKDRGELVLGIHFSDQESLQVSEEDMVDIKSPTEPVFHAHQFTFNFMSEWDHQLNGWVRSFKNRFGLYPNILLASSATYARIDLVANARGKENMHNSFGQGAPESEFISMSGFRGEGYYLDFCIEEQLPLDSVRLIYDSDPDGGLPIPDITTDDQGNKVKVS